MKRVFKGLIAILIASQLGACASLSSHSVSDITAPEPEKDTSVISQGTEPGTIVEDTDGGRYSSSRINCVVSEDMTREQMEAICEKYGLSIRYEMRTANVYTLESEQNMTLEQLDDLIEKLEKEDGIESAEKDGVVELIDPVEVTG